MEKKGHTHRASDMIEEWEILEWVEVGKWGQGNKLSVNLCRVLKKKKPLKKPQANEFD